MTGSSLTRDMQELAVHKATIEVERDDWSSAEQEAFAGVVNADDFYRVRIAAVGGAYAVASVRARCLQAAGFKEEITLALGTDGSVTGLQYSVPLRSCQPGMRVPAVTAAQAVGPAQHCPMTVAVDVPREADPVILAPLDAATAGATRQPMPPWLMGEQQEERLKQYMVQQQQQQQGARPGARQNSRPGGKNAAARKATVGKDGKTTEAEEAPPPEKSFVQQNWWFLIPIGIVVFNSLGRMMPDPPVA